LKRTVVIGVGNLLMRDDGIGVRVVEAIEKRLSESNIVTVVGETDYLYCFERILPQDRVFIVDATSGIGKPGTVEAMTVASALKGRMGQSSQHEYSLLDLVALHYPNIEGYLVGIEAEEIDIGLSLSEVLGSRFEEICLNVLGFILNIGSEENA
jgi:hydrogenase maturation protease